MEKKSCPWNFHKYLFETTCFFGVDFNDWNPHLPGTITPKTVQGYLLRSSEHVSESAISLMDENIFFGIPVPKGGSLAARRAWLGFFFWRWKSTISLGISNIFYEFEIYIYSHDNSIIHDWTLDIGSDGQMKQEASFSTSWTNIAHHPGLVG